MARRKDQSERKRVRTVPNGGRDTTDLCKLYYYSRRLWSPTGSPSNSFYLNLVFQIHREVHPACLAAIPSLRIVTVLPSMYRIFYMSFSTRASFWTLQVVSLPVSGLGKNISVQNTHLYCLRARKTSSGNTLRSSLRSHFQHFNL